MEDLFIKFTAAITKLNKLIHKIKSYEMCKFGLNPIHVSCGYYLNKNPQGLTAKELSELSLEDKAAISRALKILQEKGFVKYVPHGRNEVVQLTDKGRNFAESLDERIESAVKAARVDITDDERIFFYDSLLEISDNLKVYYQKIIKSED